MIIIGDSTVLKFPEDEIFTVNSYPGMTLLQYLRTYNDLQEDEDIIIYSFGTNDYGMGEDENSIMANYQKLKKGTKFTFIVVPACLDYDFYDKCLDLPDDLQFLESFLLSDDIHVSDEILSDLKEEILDCIKKST